MIYEKAKFFWKINSLSKKIFCVPFSDSMEYYTFLKQQHNDGYRQIIITSEIMIRLLEHFVLKERLSVYNIQFAEDDEDLASEISALLPLTASDIAFLGELIERLKFLSEKSSIDIHRIYFKGRNEKGIAINFYLQSNGIIGIDRNNYSSISVEIRDLIARYLL